MIRRLTILLLIVGCDYAPTDHTHTDTGTTVTETLYISYDTTITVYDIIVVIDTLIIEIMSNIIDREFVVIKSFTSGLDGNTTSTPVESNSNDCPSNNPPDCAGVCGDNAVEQTYYYDNDGDGLCDGTGQNWGCDLTCYNNDEGDCA